MIAPITPNPSAVVDPAGHPDVQPLVDAEARRRIREDLGSTLVVEAAAGTGKTTALVARIVAIIRAGLSPLDQIIAVTFTEAAAGEMKLRLRADLERARTDAGSTDERARLDAALGQLEAARISTIHALCADLLREHPVEAEVDPLFTVAADDEARALFDEAFDPWFQRTLESPPEGVRRILRRRRRGDGEGARETLCAAAWALLAHRDFPSGWRRDPFDRDAATDRLVRALEKCARLHGVADRTDDKLAPFFARVAGWLDELHRRESVVLTRDYDGLEADLRAVGSWYEWNWKGWGEWYQRGKIRRVEAFAARGEARTELDDFLARSEADLAPLLQRDLAPLADLYQARKSRAGKLDFLDLLLRTRDLVVSRGAVRKELQARFTHLLVDEFQDTDPIQAEILLLLAANDPAETDATRARPVPGKLFVVGDPKQSIYRFRRADVALYASIKRRLVDQGAALLFLTTSFRSAPSIQSAVNAAFSRAMKENEEGTQAQYVPLAPHRADPRDRPSIIALPTPRPYGDWGKVTKAAIDASLPDAIGAFLEWVLRESRWTVTERSPDGERQVPIEARHVCLLFKRLQWFRGEGSDVTRPYVRALEARKIPHVLVGGRSFHAREEIAALRNALTAIEWPDDELSVYATLHGPFFALGDDALLAFKAAAGSLHPLGPQHALHAARSDLADETREVAVALDVLARLHRRRNRRPIADTVAYLLDATRAHAGVAIWPTGEQSLGNVLRMIDFARRFERAGASSFRAFVERLDAQAASGQAAEAPIVEEGTDGVRMMSVHKAKGLEFPVVILADPTAPVASSTPSRHVDHTGHVWLERIAGCVPVELLERAAEVRRREEEEALRLAYVATTRARDLLVVPVVGDERCEGWLEALHPAVHPPHGRRRDAREARGIPPFRGDSVLERPDRCRRNAEDSVAPGAHAPELGEHTVVWWDPAALRLGGDTDDGVRQQAILEADSGGAAEAGERAHAAWQARRAALLERGATPTLRTTTVTEFATRPALPEPDARAHDVEHAHVDVDRSNHPRGARFGTLVHAVLATVPLDAADDASQTTIAALARAHGRLLGATLHEIDAAVVRVTAALAHPLLQRAAASARVGHCRREVAVVTRAEDGTLIEGVVDLAFRESTQWLVIDFKTDAQLSTNLATYLTQLRLYAQAITRATSAPVHPILLTV